MRRFFALVTGMLMAGSAYAQAVSTNAADTDFVRKASSASLTEIALGELAVTRASSDDVKKFASTMVADHKNANDGLAKLAASKGIQIAIAPEPAQQQLIDRLKELEGADFDRDYADATIRNLKLISGVYELEAKKGGDIDVREFALRSMTMLKEHLTMADSLPPF